MYDSAKLLTTNGFYLTVRVMLILMQKMHVFNTFVKDFYIEAMENYSEVFCNKSLLAMHELIVNAIVKQMRQTAFP